MTRFGIHNDPLPADLSLPVDGGNLLSAGADAARMCLPSRRSLAGLGSPPTLGSLAANRGPGRQTPLFGTP